MSDVLLPGRKVGRNYRLFINIVIIFAICALGVVLTAQGYGQALVLRRPYMHWPYLESESFHIRFCEDDRHLVLWLAAEADAAAARTNTEPGPP